MNDYQQSQLNKMQTACQQINEVCAGKFVWEVEINDEGHAHRLQLVDYKYPIYLSPPDKDYYGRKHWSFYTPYRPQWVQTLSYGEVATKLLDLTEPNNVGVLSIKKVTDWIEYLTARCEIMDEVSADREKVVKEFLQEAKAAGLEIKNKTLAWKSETYAGEATKNGITYSFSIDEDGYISQSIKLSYGVDRTVEAFLKLSDNKYSD